MEYNVTPSTISLMERGLFYIYEHIVPRRHWPTGLVFFRRARPLRQIVLMGLLSAPAAFICIQPRAWPTHEISSSNPTQREYYIPRTMVQRVRSCFKKIIQVQRGLRTSHTLRVFIQILKYYLSLEC